MNRVGEIKAEIQQLKDRLRLLEKELASVQARCEHQYVTTHLMRTCTKCEWSESLYY